MRQTNPLNTLPPCPPSQTLTSSKQEDADGFQPQHGGHVDTTTVPGQEKKATAKISVSSPSPTSKQDDHTQPVQGTSVTLGAPPHHNNCSSLEETQIPKSHRRLYSSDFDLKGQSNVFPDTLLPKPLPRSSFADLGKEQALCLD